MSRELGRVGVIYGGYSAEREVSLMSGQGVYEALCSQGVDAVLFDLGKQSLCELAQQGFDRVFIALHGRFGEDGCVQGALELLRIPYTGSGPMASSLAMDKLMTKRIWKTHALPSPESLALPFQPNWKTVVKQLGLPLIVKPSQEGSTIGLTRVTHLDDLPQAYRLASADNREVMAERYIAGREFTVAILGKGGNAQALPVIEIIAPGGNYDYEHKYVSNDTQYICPAELDPVLTRTIQDLAVKAYVSLGCEGWGRADFMLDNDNCPWLLEMNTSPGMTSHSLVPMAAKEVGMSYAELCLHILSTASLKVDVVDSRN